MDKKCDCSTCEMRESCFIKDKLQRLPPEASNGLGLGLCPKLKEDKENA